MHFIPTREEPLPPICTADFAFEYILFSSQSIRTFHRFQPQKSCELSIDVEEPRPLRFPCGRTVSTIIYLRLRYLYPSSLGTYSPEALRCSQPDICLVMWTTLEALTFFSTVPRDALPKQTDLEIGREVVKKADLGPTQTRKLRISTWEPLFEGDRNPDVERYIDSPCISSSPKSLHSLRIRGPEMTRIVDERYERGNLIGWQSNVPLVFTYEGDEYPVPSFACTYASRRHALSMLVRLEHHSTKYHLRIPVQIIYSSDRPQDSDSLAEESIPNCTLPAYTK